MVTGSIKDFHWDKNLTIIKNNSSLLKYKNRWEKLKTLLKENMYIKIKIEFFKDDE